MALPEEAKKSTEAPFEPFFQKNCKNLRFKNKFPNCRFMGCCRYTKSRLGSTRRRYWHWSTSAPECSTTRRRRKCSWRRQWSRWCQKSKSTTTNSTTVAAATTTSRSWSAIESKSTTSRCSANQSKLRSRCWTATNRRR